MLPVYLSYSSSFLLKLFFAYRKRVDSQIILIPLLV